ncbi:MAG: exodeoxyribonuclease V subunit alpha [Deltaproteobacteria bacterium]|nr:MAG: exodeoxyribonuclease V subunit alpha [Deltaproteobacteria bacterium]
MNLAKLSLAEKYKMHNSILKEQREIIAGIGLFSALDIHFANFMEKLSGEPSPEVWLASALVSGNTRGGDVCVDLLSVAGKALQAEEGSENLVKCPEPDAWRNALRKSRVVGLPGEYKPLILDQKARLYLFRYWEYEKEVAAFIKGRAEQHIGQLDHSLVRKGLQDLFGPDQNPEVNWQKVAAAVSMLKKFCVVTGGPGTGKTSLIARILALFVKLQPDEVPRVALLSPTGKGASRLQEAVKSAKRRLDIQEQMLMALPEQASTIHRLLGSIHGSPYFRYNARNRLPVDIVVVDEASMVDLALASKLMQALPDHARLILLGDKDQLSSVEAGSVLGDICGAGRLNAFSKNLCSDLKALTGYEIHPGESAGPGIRDCIVELRKSYRFGAQSGIWHVSDAVNRGNAQLAISRLRDERYSDIRWKEIQSFPDFQRAIEQRFLKEFEGIFRLSDPYEVFERFSRFRILCALREGPYGVEAVNAIVERILRRRRLIRDQGSWYRGRQILITRNDYELGLYNGDVGIVLEDPHKGEGLRVYFEGPEGGLRHFHPFRLPEHETVYAMTVHKSQGSEFDRVLMLLPDRDSPVLTRELIYTGITRAREFVEIWGNEKVLMEAVSRRTQRTSGLRDELWEVSGPR